MSEIQIINQYRQNVEAVQKDKNVFNSLAEYTFKDFDKNNIPKALLKAQLMGFKIEDFLTGNIYAIQFWNKDKNAYDFSIIASIDSCRKIAMKSGQSGKSEPKYEFDENKKVVSCSVTIWKDNGHEKGYTQTVYFNEYNTGKNLWVKKPMTMIAKVAEMHALRMAFPEQLSNHYIGEEMEKETVVDVTESVDIEKTVVSQETIDQVIIQIEKSKGLKSLTEYYKSLDPEILQEEQVIEAFKAKKEKCQKIKDIK